MSNAETHTHTAVATLGSVVVTCDTRARADYRAWLARYDAREAQRDTREPNTSHVWRAWSHSDTVTSDTRPRHTPRVCASVVAPAHGYSIALRACFALEARLSRFDHFGHDSYVRSGERSMPARAPRLGFSDPRTGQGTEPFVHVSRDDEVTWQTVTHASLRPARTTRTRTTRTTHTATTVTRMTPAQRAAADFAAHTRAGSVHEGAA